MPEISPQEQEEFEFRRRMEQEQGAQAKPSAATEIKAKGRFGVDENKYLYPPESNKTVQSLGKSALEFGMREGPKIAGAGVGAAIGAPAGPAGMLAGAGLGAGAVGVAERTVKQLMGGKGQTLQEGVTNIGTDILGGALQEAGPAMKAALPQIGSLGPTVTRGVENKLVRAIKPINRKTDFKQTLQRSVPDIQISAKGAPVETLEQMEPLIVDAKKRVWKEYASQLGPNAKATIDGNKIADQMESVITKRFELQNPTKAEAIREVARTYRRDIPLDEAEDFLQGANNDLAAYYKKNKVDRATAARDPDWGHVVKEAETLRKELYGKLDELAQTMGTPAAELKRRYGALHSTLEEVLRRKNVAQRQNPDSLAEQISIAQGVGRGLKAAANLNLGDAVMAAGQPLAARYIKNQNSTDTLVRKAFAEYQKGGGKDVPDFVLRMLPILTRGQFKNEQEEP